jgi:hypothetical protein
MKQLIALAVAVLGVGGASSAAGLASWSPDPGTELIWGDGGPPRYVPARAPEQPPAPRGGHELRWGTGGPPVLVPLAR